MNMDFINILSFYSFRKMEMSEGSIIAMPLQERIFQYKYATMPVSDSISFRETTDSGGFITTRKYQDYTNSLLYQISTVSALEICPG